MEPFETERLIVRQFELEDAADFFLLNSSEQTMQFIRPVKNRQESDAFLAENLDLYLEGFPYGRMCVLEKHNGNFIGTFSILYLDGDADYHIGYALLPQFWGKGYATELVAQGVAIFFERTNHPNLYAITNPENTASEKVLTRNGFLINGVFKLDEMLLNKFVLQRADII